jgi:hypothetical protein
MHNLSKKLFLGVLLLEAINTTFSIHNFLSASVEWVGAGRNIYFKQWIFFALKSGLVRSLDGRFSQNFEVTRNVSKNYVSILWVNTFFHTLILICINVKLGQFTQATCYMSMGKYYFFAAASTILASSASVIFSMTLGSRLSSGKVIFLVPALI